MYYVKTHKVGLERRLLIFSGLVTARYDYDPWGPPHQCQRQRPRRRLRFHRALLPCAKRTVGNVVLCSQRGVGRWVSRDQPEETDDPNLYSYLNDSPHNMTDPLGLRSAISPGPLRPPGTGVAPPADCGALAWVIFAVARKTGFWLSYQYPLNRCRIGSWMGKVNKVLEMASYQWGTL